MFKIGDRVIVNDEGYEGVIGYVAYVTSHDSYIVEVISVVIPAYQEGWGRDTDSRLFLYMPMATDTYLYLEDLTLLSEPTNVCEGPCGETFQYAEPRMGFRCAGCTMRQEAWG